MKSFYTGRPFIYSSVVLVLAVLGLIALPAFTSVCVSCHKSPLNQITAIRSTLSLYIKDNDGMLPDNLDALLPYTTNKQLSKISSFSHRDAGFQNCHLKPRLFGANTMMRIMRLFSTLT
jgi:hypothetical protein